MFEYNSVIDARVDNSLRLYCIQFNHQNENKLHIEVISVSCFICMVMKHQIITYFGEK